jgi:Protein of unknown function (DUF3551)
MMPGAQQRNARANTTKPGGPTMPGFSMRTMLAAAAIAGAASVLAASNASAQYYPWCSIYNDKGSQNCGFVSFQQCMANVRGIGGSCALNPWAARPEIRGYGQIHRRR